MKKYLYTIIILLAVIIVPYLGLAQSPSVWYPTSNYLRPVSSTWGLLIPGLASSTTGCLSVGSSGWISASGSACGTGEANTGSSLGTGLNLFDTKSGVDLRFNTLSAGTNITLSTTSNNNTIVINNAYGDSNVNSYIHASTTIPKTYTSNTFTGLQSFSNTSTTTFLGGISTTGLLANNFIETKFINATSTTATSTFAGNLWVKGNQQVDGALFAPITFTAGDVSLTSLTLTNPLAVAYGGTGATSGYNNTNWDTAYTNRITSAVYPLSIASNIISTAMSSSTLTASSPLTGSFAQVGTGGSLGCQTASGSQAGCLSSTDWTTFNNKGAGTVTSLIVGEGLLGGTITTSGTIYSQVGTSTIPVLGQLAYWSSLGTVSSPAKLTSIATSSETCTSPLSCSSFSVVGSSGAITLGDVKQYPAFTYATSTAWTGTTTIPLGTAYVAETWNGAKCFTDVGTVNVSFYDGTNRMDMLNASTTVGTFTLSTNNAFTASEKRYVDIGTPLSSPTKVSCTISKTLSIN